MTFQVGQEVWIRGRIEQYDADDGIYMVTTACGYNDERKDNFIDESFVRPVTEKQKRLEKLIEEWRKPHDGCKEDDHKFDCFCSVYDDCADELEAAL